MSALPIRMVEKPWGKDVLPAPFVAPAGQRIGEVWFEPPEALKQLLVKYLFTSEKLSVQVHPSDDQTIEAGLGKQGKEECWLVVVADEGAALGIGFNQPISPRDMRMAATDGTIEALMTWIAVKPGDFFYIPAGTVHAIGAGVSLIEVQQNSDVTYRLYDYGRPRPLHLNEGIGVAKGETYADPRCCHVPERGEVALVEGPLFRLIRYDGPLSAESRARLGTKPVLVIPQNAGATVKGEGLAAGSCAAASAAKHVVLAPGALGLIAQPLY